MRISRKVRRWWLGPNLYDRAASTIAAVEANENAGRLQAEAWLRENGLGHLIRDDA